MRVVRQRSSAKNILEQTYPDIHRPYSLVNGAWM
jgi:hypothetical protein